MFFCIYDFGGTLYEYIGRERALDLIKYVDEINMRYGGEGTKLYSTAGTRLKKECIKHDLHLLDASVRHLGTDINYVVLENLYAYLQNKVDFYFDTPVETVAIVHGGVIVQRFGDLIRGKRSTPDRIEEAFITPTLKATPGDLSLVLPKVFWMAS